MKADEPLISAKELPWQKPISHADRALEIYHQLTWDREGSHLFVVVQNTVYQDPGNFPIKTRLHAAEPSADFCRGSRGQQVSPSRVTFGGSRS
jgi:hypothetical protein